MSIKDFFMKPQPLPYDYDEWNKLCFNEKTKMICQAWAMQGFGAPKFAILFYTLKIILYVWVWTFFCSLSIELGSLATINSWWFKLEALEKAVAWTMLIESVGFGGASGPLTARYMPPLGGILYYLRPGTIKVPFFKKLSDTRNLIDIGLYVAFIFFLLKLCLASIVTADFIIPIIIILPILGILDTQLFFSARGDVWFPALFVFIFPDEIKGGLIAVWFGVWFWAAFSKLTSSFPSVVSVMISNSPFLDFKWLKKLLYKSYPNDLRMRSSANFVAHLGTVIEFILPIIMLLNCLYFQNLSLGFYVIIGISIFHLFIFINFPMGVPLEWNVMMVYGAWVLFGSQNATMPIYLHSPFLLSLLFTSLFLLPLLGNFFPKYISFLLSMRYYAGTWAYSVWFFKGDSKNEKLEPNIIKTSPDLRTQLEMLYDKKTTLSILSRTISFRSMHLPGRALGELVPKAVINFNDYYWIDGEMLAGEVVGWNFGEGHLHSEKLLHSIQKRCHFDSEELRVIMVESPRLHNGQMHWRIYDAKDGLIEDGFVYIKDLKEKMPWRVDT